MSDTNAPHHLLTPKEAAELLRISKMQLWRLRDAGRLPPAIRLSPRVYRWRRADLMAWIEREAA